ncbi:MAG: 3-deoxy-manno-octulosonate cytidylyltransferase [Gemmatimonadales bacterium]|nr:3-deoxy-manno-octulosonate cytidylyltransferase [Gemmatimonadales bacterium]
MPVLGVVPARLGSSRLTRKPLQLLGGEPLVVRVWERVRAMAVFDEVVIATDAPEVRAVVERAGGRVVMTSSAHESGTDRVAEVVGQADFSRFDLIVNVQGDEPFLPLEAVTGSVERVRAGHDIGTAAVPIEADAALDPARVKVVTDRRGRALYFSRARIPFLREPTDQPAEYWQHLGVYAYSRDGLARWVAEPPTALERAERLEQLRALDLGLSIGVTRLAEPAPPGIDTPDDLAWAERHWNAHTMGGGIR